MNKVILIGNLANDPEPFTTQSGISRSTFRIAVQRRFANAQGVREADFLTVVAWRQSADFCNRYLSKGRRVAVEGSIQVRSYDAQDGQKRYVTEIIADNVEALGGREEGGQPRNYGDNGPTPPPAPPAQNMPSTNEFTEVDDDELPF
jgi:single-strand DNA-binding protein